jgi:hypothetical protein
MQNTPGTIKIACTAKSVWRKLNRRFFLHGLMMLTLAAVPLCRASEPKETTIKYQKSRRFNAILVIANINNKSAVLIVDTGSDRTIVSPDFVTTDQLSGEFRVSFLTAHRSTLSAWGKIALQLSHKTWKEHVVVVQDFSELRRTFQQKIDGILGQDILSQFRKVTIDSETQTLTLQE